MFYQLYANNIDINAVKTWGTSKFLFGKEGENCKIPPFSS